MHAIGRNSSNGVVIIITSKVRNRLRIPVLELKNMDVPPLFSAILHNPHTVELLIKRGADINQVFDDWCPLRLATHQGDLSLVQLLLDHGADMSRVNASNETLMHTACRDNQNSYDLCKLFLEKGADCNSQNSLGCSPFHVSLMKQPLEVIILLLEFGANIAWVDSRGESALHFAAYNTHVDVIAFVLNQGFDIEAISYTDGITVLSHAVLGKNYEGCKFLLERGASIKESLWLCTLLSTEEDSKILELLLAYEATVSKRVLLISVSKGISNILVRHLAKRTYQNLSINAAVLQLIENSIVFKSYYRDCLQELKNMNDTEVYGTVSVFNILMGSRSKISGYARNKELVTALEEKNYDQMFPIYSTCLKKRFYVQVEKQKLLHSAAEVLGNIFMFNDPSHLVMQNIFEYLSEEDLKYIVGGYNVPLVFH